MNVMGKERNVCLNDEEFVVKLAKGKILIQTVENGT